MLDYIQIDLHQNRKQEGRTYTMNTPTNPQTHTGQSERERESDLWCGGDMNTYSSSAEAILGQRRDSLLKSDRTKGKKILAKRNTSKEK